MGFSEALRTEQVLLYKMDTVVIINQIQLVGKKINVYTAAWCILVVLMDVQQIATVRSTVKFFSSNNSKLKPSIS